MPSALSSFVAWWSSLYGNHSSVALTVTVLHLAGIVVGGGTALTVDRQVLRSRSGTSGDRTHALRMLGDAHSVVVAAMAVIGLTGVLMFMADVDTFVHSRVFWTKMALVVLLAANGGVLVVARKPADVARGAVPWTSLALTAAISAALWLIVLVLGEWLRVG